MREHATQAAGYKRGPAVESDRHERVAGEQPSEPGEQFAVGMTPVPREAYVARVRIRA
jgi:hypothetical protein